MGPQFHVLSLRIVMRFVDQCLLVGQVGMCPNDRQQISWMTGTPFVNYQCFLARSLVFCLVFLSEFLLSLLCTILFGLDIEELLCEF